MISSLHMQLTPLTMMIFHCLKRKWTNSCVVVYHRLICISKSVVYWCYCETGDFRKVWKRKSANNSQTFWGLANGTRLRLLNTGPKLRVIECEIITGPRYKPPIVIHLLVEKSFINWENFVNSKRFRNIRDRKQNGDPDFGWICNEWSWYIHKKFLFDFVGFWLRYPRGIPDSENRWEINRNI